MPVWALPLLEAHQLKLTESKNSLWISSPEYTREIKLGKPIVPFLLSVENY